MPEQSDSGAGETESSDAAVGVGGATLDKIVTGL